MFVFHHSSCHSSYSRAVSLSLSSPSSQLYAYTLKVSVLFLLLTPYVKLVFISHYCCVQKKFHLLLQVFHQAHWLMCQFNYSCVGVIVTLKIFAVLRES